MIQFYIITRANEVENLCNQLSLLGASGISLEDAATQPIYEPLPGEDIVWQQTTITAIFEDPTIQTALSHYLENAKSEGHLISYRVEPVANKDWVRESLDQFQPQRIGNKLWICPSWHQPPDPMAINVLLDPGLAFGTGTHPTTQLCLEWLEEHITGGETVIDYGCGSGILSVAALMLGAAFVTAVDHDQQALEACKINLMRNHLSDKKLEAIFPEQVGQYQVDILIANILAQPLMSLADHFTSLMKPNGKIVLSGILPSQTDELYSVYEKNFNLAYPVIKNGWVRLDGRKKDIP